MSYCKLKDCWIQLEKYNLSGKKYTKEYIVEEYTPPVTLSFPEWKQYIVDGKHILLGSGGVIPGGTINTPFGGSAVYRGHIRQGCGSC